MAKKKSKKLARALMAPGPAIGKSKQTVVQEAFDDELKDSVRQYISNVAVPPVIGGKPLVADEAFSNALKRLRETQVKVLQLIEDDERAAG
jgi:hypothetical protein